MADGVVCRSTQDPKVESKAACKAESPKAGRSLETTVLYNLGWLRARRSLIRMVPPGAAAGG